MLSGEHCIWARFLWQAITMKNKQKMIYTAWTKRMRKQSGNNWKICGTITFSYFTHIPGIKGFALAKKHNNPCLINLVLISHKSLKTFSMLSAVSLFLYYGMKHCSENISFWTHNLTAIPAKDIKKTIWLYQRHNLYRKKRYSKELMANVCFEAPC